MLTRRHWIGTALATLIAGHSARAQSKRPGEIDPPHSEPVWALLVIENHGAQTHCAGVFETQGEANTFALALPPPTTDRVCVPVPTVLHRVHGRQK